MSNFQQVKRHFIYKFFKKHQDNSDIELVYDEDLYKLFFLIFVADYDASINKLHWSTSRMERYFKQNYDRFENLFKDILALWDQNDEFLNLEQIPFGITQYEEYVNIDNVVFNVSRFCKINTIIFRFIREKYPTNLDAEWNKAFYALIIYVLLFYRLEGWLKRKTNEYDYHAILHVRLYLINMFSTNLQPILKEKFNDLFLLFNELYPCELYIS